MNLRADGYFRSLLRLIWASDGLLCEVCVNLNEPGYFPVFTEPHLSLSASLREEDGVKRRQCLVTERTEGLLCLSFSYCTIISEGSSSLHDCLSLHH